MSKKTYDTFSRVAVARSFPTGERVGIVVYDHFYPLDVRTGTVVPLREQVLKHARGFTEVSFDGGKTWRELDWTHRSPA